MSTGRARILALLGVLVLLVGAVVWAFWPSRPGAAGGGVAGLDPGIATTGSASGPGSGNHATDRTSNSSSTNGPDNTAGVDVPGPDVRPGHLQVSARRQDQGPLQYTLQVSVTNDGGGPAAWHVVALQLSGVSVTVTVGPVVTDMVKSPVHCLVAADAAVTVAPGGASVFDVTVTTIAGGVLGGVDALGLDEAPCMA